MNKTFIYSLIALFSLYTTNSFAQDYQWFETSYQFEDIKNPDNIVSQLAGSQNGTTVEINLSNYFNFYQTDYSRIKISVNGAITFDANSSTIGAFNSELPSMSAQKLLIAPYWNDLSNAGAISEIYYHSNLQRSIIQWDNLDILNTGGTITMQAVLLYSDNSITFSYKSITETTLGSSQYATVGIQNIDGTQGLQLNYNDFNSVGFNIENFKSYKLLIPAANPPVMTPDGRTFEVESEVVIETFPAEAVIYYTTDGSTPTSGSILYSSPITINSATILKAISVINDYTSPVIEQRYDVIENGTVINGGDFYGNLTLTNSPYYILGNINIPQDNCLSIEAGVELIFTGNFSIVLNGCITANGTQANPITFDKGFTATTWAGIRFPNSSPSNGVSLFNFCEFRNSATQGTNQPLNTGGVLYIEGQTNISISNSHFENNFAQNKGGAIYCIDSDIEISNTTFLNNYAEKDGGAISIFNGNFTLTDNVFTNNIANDNGGALYINSSTVTILRNNFSFNSTNGAFGAGGGIYAGVTSGEISHNEIHNNEAYSDGGGVVLSGSNNLFFAYNNIHNNKTLVVNRNRESRKLKIVNPAVLKKKELAPSYISNSNFKEIQHTVAENPLRTTRTYAKGGGLVINNGTGIVASNKIQNNYSDYNGGGISVSGGEMNITSNLIAYNTSLNSGGGIFFNAYSGLMVNNSIVFNQASAGGDGIYLVASSPDIYNSLFWYNYGDSYYGDIYISNDGSMPNFYNCSNTYGIDGIDGDWFGGWSFTGVFDNYIPHYPSFERTDNSISGLADFSPMINAGTPDVSLLMLPEFDANGNPRIADGVVDAGCFEFQGSKITNIIGGQMSGDIFEGVHYVDRDIFVPLNETLTINAGADLRFYGNHGFIIEGTLEALGTAENLIHISTADTTAFYSQIEYTTGAWKHIVFNNPDVKSTLSYVDFSYSKVNNLYATSFENQAGGTILVMNSSPNFSNCTFNNSFTYGAGGAIAYFDCELSGGKIENCGFTNGIAVSEQFMLSAQGGKGGAIYIQNSSPLISSCILAGNSALQGNGSYGIGGAIYALNSQSLIINNTVADNYSPNGGGIYCFESEEISQQNNLSFVNNILWNNTADDILYGYQMRIDGSTLNINLLNNNIQGGLASITIGEVDFNGTFTNNINLNPNFLPNIGDYRLQESSPCIDAGIPSGSGFNFSHDDIACNPRISNQIVDIGAYEFQQTVGIQNNKNKFFSIYPNPSSGKIKIQLPESYKNSVISVSTIAGMTIYQEESNNINSQTIDLSDLAKGLYIISINNRRKTLTDKIIFR